MTLSRRVAVIHGQRRIVAFLELELREKGFIVDSAENADDAFQLIRSREPHVIVLDPKLPGLDGLAFLRLSRLYTQVPIVMLGIDFDRGEQVACIENGADYCLSLPADLRELIALLHAAMRRSKLHAAADVHVVADLVVNVTKRTAVRSSRTLTLTRREFDLLAVLAREPNRVFSRCELLTLVWGEEHQSTERAIDTCILGLRRKLDAPFGEPILHTVRGVGFSLRPARRTQMLENLR